MYADLFLRPTVVKSCAADDDFFSGERNGCLLYTSCGSPDCPSGHSRTTTPDGGTWEFGYDRSGNLVSRTNPEGAVTRMTYRNGGNTHFGTLAGGLGSFPFDDPTYLVPSDSRA